MPLSIVSQILCEHSSFSDDIQKRSLQTANQIVVCIPFTLPFRIKILLNFPITKIFYLHFVRQFNFAPSKGYGIVILTQLRN